jgi:plasmid stabilization system protein ParE
MKIKLLSSAMQDLYEGRLFYEKQGEGLGEYFFNSLFSDIDSLTLYGGTHPKHFDCHRLLSKRFPYAIYYRVEGESVVVWRILDLRRNPRKMRQSLEWKRAPTQGPLTLKSPLDVQTEPTDAKGRV